MEQLDEDELQTLVDRAAAGDRAAVDRLLAEYLPGLRAFVRVRAGAVIRERESSSDIVQSVCREVLEHVDRFQHPDRGGFKQWLYLTAQRKLQDRFDFWHAGKREAGLEVRIEAQDSRRGDDGLLACYRTFSTPSQGLAAAEEVDRIEAALSQLPPEHREVIALAKIAGLSRREVAERMGRSEESVRGLLARALAGLAAGLRLQGS